jgi:hypothetical protein
MTNMGEERNMQEILKGERETKKSRGRSRLRWKDVIQMDLRGTGWKEVDCIHLFQDRDQWRALENTAMSS